MTTTATQTAKDQINAELARQKLETLFVEKRDEVITVLAYRLHQDGHAASVPSEERPSWADSLTLATDSFDAAIEALARVILQAESVPPVTAARPAAPGGDPVPTAAPEPPAPASEPHQD